MKVRRKAPEETAMEKRNTSILNFALVAFIPLLLMLFLGFSLDKGVVVNEKNLFEKLNNLKENHQTLKGEIVKLDSTFSYGDILLKHLNKNVKEHIKQLPNIESSITMTPWGKDKEAIIENFKYEVDKVERNYDLDENSLLNPHLELGKKWLREIAESKKDEFEAMELIREKELTFAESHSSDDGSDLQGQVQTLNMQLLQKDFEISNLQRDLSDCASEAGDDNATLSGQLATKQQKIETAKTNIRALLDEISTKLEEIEGKGFLKSNKDEITNFKNQLNSKLNNINNALTELN